MALELRLNQKLDLQLKLSPQIIQSIEILQLPSIDLEDLVHQELDTNEYLEVAPDELEDEQPPPPPDDRAALEPEEKIAVQELERMEEQGLFESEMPRVKSALDWEASDRKMEAMNNTAGRGPSLHEYLLEQYGLLDVDPALRPLGEAIIMNINEIGRLDRDLQEITKEFPEITPEQAQEALRGVQALEPRGIGARTTQECLLLQLDPGDPNYELKRELITDYLEDLAKNRRPKITKALGITFEQLDELVRELSEMDDQPGRSAVDVKPHYIYPDVVVEWTPNGYDVRLASDNLPPLKVDEASYRLISRDKTADPEFKEQAKEQFEKAKLLVQAIEQRQNTLLRVARRIVHYQYDFLEFGPHHLRPLKMQQVADDLGIHVSTVSRATHEKYMQTHRGIFPMKFFFAGAAESVNGGMESRNAVKQRVKEIIDREDKHDPLSDEEIVRRLRDNFGIKVARRTVTKYRKALGIPSTRQRKVFSED